MDAVFKEYGHYILAVLACAAVIFGVSEVFGLFNSSFVPTSEYMMAHPDEAYNVTQGNGFFGTVIQILLNRVM